MVCCVMDGIVWWIEVLSCWVVSGNGIGLYLLCEVGIMVELGGGWYGDLGMVVWEGGGRWDEN